MTTGGVGVLAAPDPVHYEGATGGPRYAFSAPGRPRGPMYDAPLGPAGHPIYANWRPPPIGRWDRRNRIGGGLLVVIASAAWLVLDFSVLKWDPTANFNALHSSARFHQFAGLPQAWCNWGAYVAVGLLVALALMVTIPSHSRDEIRESARAMVLLLALAAATLQVVSVILIYRDTGAGARWMALSAAVAFVTLGLGATAGVGDRRVWFSATQPHQPGPSVLGLAVIVVLVLGCGGVTALRATDTKPFHPVATSVVGSCNALVREGPAENRAGLMRQCWNPHALDTTNSFPVSLASPLASPVTAPPEAAGSQANTSLVVSQDPFGRFRIAIPDDWTTTPVTKLGDDHAVLPPTPGVTIQTLFDATSPDTDAGIQVYRYDRATPFASLPDYAVRNAEQAIENAVSEAGVVGTTALSTVSVDGHPAQQMTLDATGAAGSIVVAMRVFAAEGHVWELLVGWPGASVLQATELLSTFQLPS